MALDTGWGWLGARYQTRELTPLSCGQAQLRRLRGLLIPAPKDSCSSSTSPHCPLSGLGLLGLVLLMGRARGLPAEGAFTALGEDEDGHQGRARAARAGHSPGQGQGCRSEEQGSDVALEGFKRSWSTSTSWCP